MGSFKKIILLLISLIVCPILYGYTIPWRQKTSFQFAKEISLNELIRSYFALQGITVVIDSDIQGSINGKFQDLSPEEFLNRISRSNGLIWFYDGNVLYVYPAQKVESKFVPVSKLASQKLLETISSLGIVAPSSSIRLVGETGIAFVSGPPKYVEMITDVIKQLNESLDTEFKEALQVRVFPLQHAWAYDTSFTTQETRITLPGLATILRGLMQTDMPISPQMIISGQINADRIQVADKMKTFNQLNNLVTSHKKEILPINNYDPTALPPVPPIASTGATLIQPDMRLNAIIVRDVGAKMPQYETIIKALDVGVYLVEIAVTIVDINTDFSSAIGNQFFSATNNAGNGFAFNTTSNAVDGILAPASGFNFQAKAIWDGYKIISDIEALATEGYANILARPTVLTLNNMEALISKTETFYVQLLGVDTSDLATVTVGTTLRVTPRVIIEEDDPRRRIQLLINLNDGDFDPTATSTFVDGLPTTTDSSITTQAVIYEGQSLFVGGYYKQRKESSETGIPLLKDLPIIGYAFKIKKQLNTTIERMYLITPRIINLDYEHAPDITDQICDMTPPPMGIAREMAKDNMKCEFPYCPTYEPDLDCCTHPSNACYRRPKNLGVHAYRYFE